MKAQPSLTFQSLILRLEKFWADRGCLIWQPYYQQVGAGTMNPATFLRVLGPEPWNVAYVEPSIRPDDGRYGENPNRFQQHYQYQVILKPDPGNPQELYLQSLEAIGINPREHDIRFVEDNWEQPAIAAWGLGWEVWLDGQEITQFTYFQQVGGQTLDPVPVELTYGLERIFIGLRNAKAIWDEPWAEAPGGAITYGEVLRRGEFEHSKFYFELASVESLRQMMNLYEAEVEAALKAGLVLPAYDHVLKCSHTFNVLDTRGAIGVTERQAAFGRIRALARKVAETYLEQRQQLEYPLIKGESAVPAAPGSGSARVAPVLTAPTEPQMLAFEIGTEELPAADVDTALAQLQTLTPKFLADAKLTCGAVEVFGTPRRLTVLVHDLAPRQPDSETLVKGPPAARAFTAAGEPTPAAEGFARSKGLTARDLQRRTVEGGEYMVALVREQGKPTPEVLTSLLPKLIAAIKFEKTMRWRAGDSTAFSRPIRWLVALLGEQVIPFEYAGVSSGNVSRGLRPLNSPPLTIPSAEAYRDVMRQAKIEIDPAARRAAILKQARRLAREAGGAIADEGVLNEVANLVERPTALLGTFDEEHLALPREALVAVMKKHQRYFPVERDGRLMPNFVVIRNGDARALELVRDGNEHVVRARFADAAFFVREDIKRALEDFRGDLAKLTFQKKLGSMLDKAERIERLAGLLAERLQLSAAETAVAIRGAHLCKADLATQMVVEMTSLQGIMGSEYALRSGETPAVAQAIREHYGVPASRPGVVVALADRLDSLAGLFAAGLAPSGSADPFGLRRAALGVNQLLMDWPQAVDLRTALQAALDLQPAAVQPVPATVLTDLLAFLAGRLRGQLTEGGERYDVVEAILAEQAHYPQRAAQAVRQLAAWVKREDWAVTLAAYARCVRITRSVTEVFPITDDRWVEPAERALYAAYQTAAATAPATVDEFFGSLLPMIPAITAFFDQVLVMAEDPAVRANRLGLLQRIAALASGVADLSKLEGF